MEATAFTSLTGALRVSWNGAASRWRLANSRTEAPARLLVGRSSREVAVLIGRIFGICRIAQGVAGARALEQAVGRAGPPAVERAREQLAELERSREQLVRHCLVLPRLLGMTPEPAPVAELQRYERSALALAGGLLEPGAEPELSALRAVEEARAGARACVAAWLGAFPGASGRGGESWYARAQSPAAALCRALLARGWAGLGAARRPALPLCGASLPTAGALATLGTRLFAEADFARYPTWRGEPHETGAFARWRDEPLVAAAVAAHGPGLLARHLASLLDLAHEPQPVPAGVAALDAGRIAGIGGAPTARGVLFHGAVLDDGRTAAYRIVAPTEWNFHPAGAAAEALADLAGPGEPEAEAQVRLVAGVYDPCTPIIVEAPHA